MGDLNKAPNDFFDNWNKIKSMSYKNVIELLVKRSSEKKILALIQSELDQFSENVQRSCPRGYPRPGLLRGSCQRCACPTSPECLRRQFPDPMPDSCRSRSWFGPQRQGYSASRSGSRQWPGSYGRPLRAGSRSSGA